MTNAATARPTDSLRRFRMFGLSFTTLLILAGVAFFAYRKFA